MTAAVVTPRLTMNDVFGRALVTHEGGDNYSDVPLPNGGGPRMACGVVATATPVTPPAALAALVALLLTIAAQTRRRAAPNAGEIRARRSSASSSER